ncbi:MAG: acetyl-CoA carboxylase [Candidatus Bipolaricaulota bacterium]|nr:acetyl-CoA carboxylase [Candidatus Bipolaricaulota bacterium]
MNIEELREIVRLLKREQLSEITVSDGESTITVRQSTSHAAPAATAPESPTPATPAAAVPDGLLLTAPLVGTFYRRPTPEDAPFVEVGQSVKPGDTVGLIEAMKVMNEIKTESAGRLRVVMAEDGAPVEYGQVLFVFDPL